MIESRTTPLSSPDRFSERQQLRQDAAERRGVNFRTAGTERQNTEPAPCNTGSAPNRSNARPGDAPAHVGKHFNELRHDTMKLSAKTANGPWTYFESLKKRARQGDNPSVKGPDGRTFRVSESKPNDNRAVLMQTADGGITITAIGYGDAPDLAIEYSAVHCYHHELHELTQWARDWCTQWGIEIESTLVSRLDLCVDLDGERFYASDKERFEGQVTRMGWAQQDNEYGRPESIYIPRKSGSGRRPLTVRIYDKRAEDEQGHKSFWSQVYESHGLSDDKPVWRVEFEARRARLRERGIDTWDDLDRAAVERFWTYCVTDYCRMDRQVWDKVQDASPRMGAPRREIATVFDPEQLKAQVIGIIEKLEQENVLDEETAELLQQTIEAEHVDTETALVQVLRGLDSDTAARLSNIYHASTEQQVSPRAAPSFPSDL